MVLYSDWVKYTIGGCESSHRDVKVSSTPITPAYNQLFYGVSSLAPLIFLSTITTTLLSLTLGNQHSVIFYYHKLWMDSTHSTEGGSLQYLPFTLHLHSFVTIQIISSQSQARTEKQPMRCQEWKPTFNKIGYSKEYVLECVEWQYLDRTRELVMRFLIFSLSVIQIDPQRN